MSTPDPNYIALYQLQQVIINKDTGQVLDSGVVTFFEDDNRTIRKNVYQIAGSTGSYTFASLGSQLTLSTAGTFVDEGGNDIVLYVKPYDDEGNIQKYYITFVSKTDVDQFTRENVPSNLEAATPTIASDNFNNIVTNGAFYYNVGTTGAISTTTTKLCLGANTNLDTGDICLIKNNTNADDSVTFNLFTLGASPIADTGPAQYYMTYNCTNIPIGETSKYIYVPITQGVNNLNGQTITVSFWARSSLSNDFTPFFVQNFGTGGSPSAAVNTQMGSTLSLTPTWTRYTATITIPTTTGKTLGSLGNDFIYLRFELEKNQQNVTDFAQVQIEMGTTPTVDYTFEPQQVVAGKVLAPRTGDVKATLINQSLPSWLLMDDGTIGYSSSNATTRANKDTWFLYNLIYSNVAENLAPVYTSAGILTSRSTVSVDFLNGVQLALTKQLGRALVGANPSDTTVTTQTISAVSTGTSAFTVASTASYTAGQPVQIYSTTHAATPAPIYGNSTYYMIIVDGTHFQLAYTYDDALAVNFIVLTTTGGANLVVANTDFGTPIYSSQFTASIASGTDYIQVPDATSLLVGSAVKFKVVGGGVLPTPLTAAAIYFVIPFDATRFQVATTRANALAGTFIDLTVAGTSPCVVYTLNMPTVPGDYFGEETHAPTLIETATHVHAMDTTAPSTAQSGTPFRTVAGTVTTFTFDTQPAGNNGSFNVIQPSAYYNIYIKL